MAIYRQLIAWQRSMALVTHVYRASQSFPSSEMYGLTSQMRRAAVSIPSNIAEGKGRDSTKEYFQFLCRARGSLLELETQIEIARNLDYLSEQAYRELTEHSSEVGRVLNGLTSAIQKKSRLSRPLTADR